MLLECLVGLGQSSSVSDAGEKTDFLTNCKNVQVIRQIKQLHNNKLIISEIEIVKDRKTIPESVSMICAVPKRHTRCHGVSRYLGRECIRRGDRHNRHCNIKCNMKSGETRS